MGEILLNCLLFFKIFIKETVRIDENLLAKPKGDSFLMVKYDRVACLGSF
jgi:hypothetical protein